MIESVLKNKIPVQPANVSAELTRAWREAATADSQVNGDPESERHARVKATLSNLLAVTAGSNDSLTSSSLDDLIRSLTIKHPSRFFVLEFTNDGSTDLKTAVSSQCVLAQSGAHVCSEEIYIALSPERVNDAGNLILSLLAPDAQSVCLLLCDPAHPELQASGPRQNGISSFTLLGSSLERISDLIIFDSQLFPNYSASINLLNRFADNYLPNGRSFALESSYGSSNSQRDFPHKLRDLNWSRLKRWQKLISEQFNSKHLLNSLPQLEKISLHCNCSLEDLKNGRIPAKALLIAAWISDCLGLKTSAEEYGKFSRLNCSFTLQSTGFPMNFLAREDHKIGVPSFGLAEVEFSFNDGSDVKSVSFARSSTEECGIIETCYKESRPCDPEGSSSSRRVPFVEARLEDLVLKNIVIGDEVQHFRQTCLKAIQLAKEIKNSSY